MITPLRHGVFRFLSQSPLTKGERAVTLGVVMGSFQSDDSPDAVSAKPLSSFLKGTNPMS